MDTTWSLKELYDSFESEEFQRDLKDAQEAIERFGRWASENLTERDQEKEKIEEVIRIRLDLEKYDKPGDFAQLSLSVNSEDKQAVKAMDKVRELYANMTAPQVMFEKYVMTCEKLEEYISQSPLLKEHKFYLGEIRQNGKYLLSEAEENILSKLRITGSDAWKQMKDQVVGAVVVDFKMDGEIKQMTLPMLRNLAYHGDREVRQNALQAELALYKGVEKPAAAALNAIKGEAITICKARGYDSPLDMTLKNSRMDRETLDAMMDAMRDYLPSFHKFFRKKAELLGHTGPLPWYDLFAPAGNVEMNYTLEEAADYVVENFNAFSSELGDYARNAFDKRWIDVYPRRGKSGGAFCAGLHYLKESRVLANFNGSFDSMLTFAHELGHGFHGHCLNDESVLNCSYPMPIAETASTFCETLVTQAALKSAAPKEAAVIMENEISGCAQIVVDIYSRFLFEDEFFRRRAEGSLSAEEINELMLDSQKKAYGDSLDPDSLNPGMWICKTHYYYVERNYYNFPYAYGQLFALGLYKIFKKEGASFVNRYKEMLAATGKKNLADIGSMMGINVRDKAFWASSLEVVKEEIEEFCSLA